MNQGRIWCVVNPSLGLPLLLGSVALTSLAVHASVMTHTTWMSDYWMGSRRVKVSENTTPPVAVAAANVGAGFSLTVSPVPAVDASSPASFVITVTPEGATAGHAKLAAVGAGRAPGSDAVQVAETKRLE